MNIYQSMRHHYHTIKRRKRRRKNKSLKMRGGKSAKKPDMAEQAGKVGAKTAKVLTGVTKNATIQIKETKDKILDMGLGATKKGKRLWNKIRRSVKGQILNATDKFLPTYTEKEVDHLEKKIAKKAAKVSADGLEAGSNIVKNMSTNPKLQRQAKKLAKNTFEAAKDGAEVAMKSAGKLYEPAKEAAGAAASAATVPLKAATTIGVGLVKEAAFAVPGVADVYNIVATGAELGDQAMKGATKVGKAAVEVGKLSNAAMDEAMDLPEDAMAGIKKVKKLAGDVANLAEDAVEPPRKKRPRPRRPRPRQRRPRPRPRRPRPRPRRPQTAGRKTRKKRHHRRRTRKKKRKRRRKHPPSRRFRRRKKRRTRRR